MEGGLLHPGALVVPRQGHSPTEWTKMPSLECLKPKRRGGKKGQRDTFLPAQATQSSASGTLTCMPSTGDHVKIKILMAQVWSRAQKSAFLLSSLVMLILLVYGPHFQQQEVRRHQLRGRGTLYTWLHMYLHCPSLFILLVSYPIALGRTSIPVIICPEGTSTKIIFMAFLCLSQSNHLK